MNLAAASPVIPRFANSVGTLAWKSEIAFTSAAASFWFLTFAVTQSEMAAMLFASVAIRIAFFCS